MPKCHHKGKLVPHSKRAYRVLEMIPVLGSQPAGDRSHNPDGRLPLLSARPAVTFTAAEHRRAVKKHTRTRKIAVVVRRTVYVECTYELPLIVDEKRGNRKTRRFKKGQGFCSAELFIFICNSPIQV